MLCVERKKRKFEEKMKFSSFDFYGGRWRGGDRLAAVELNCFKASLTFATYYYFLLATCLLLANNVKDKSS